MPCIECARGLHEECHYDESTGEGCCCPKEEIEPTPIFSETVAFPDEVVKKGRPLKENISISAGRKRAAEIYGSEMGNDKPCEWRFMANCGGGAYPISGCATGTRKHIHHGPIKNTGHNERGNISLICEYCHNRWHAKNDPVYKEEAFALLPKQPRLMTLDECLLILREELKRREKKKDE